MNITFKKNFLKNYLTEAPIPLAIERSLECTLLSQENFERPILDIGCGEGLFAHILFAEKIDLGIDPNEKELKRAEQYNCYHKLINCFGNDIPIPDKSFKTVFSNSVVEHISEIGLVLKEIYRVLDDKGNLYLTLPTHRFEEFTVINTCLNFMSFKNLAIKYRKFFNRFWKHYHCYDQNSWAKLFQEHGFKVFKIKNYGSKKICLLNDFLAPFSLTSFMNKKITNRWFYFKFMAHLFSKIKYAILRPFLKNQSVELNDAGGLIFFHLKKEI